jgi:hypothetical protein
MDPGISIDVVAKRRTASAPGDEVIQPIQSLTKLTRII